MIRSLLVAAAAIALLAPAAAAADTPDAEIFATDNTALITDPDDPRLDDPLTEFARTVERIVDRGGGKPRGSQLLDGVFFSSDLGGTTFERSRRFDVDRVSDSELHAIAGCSSPPVMGSWPRSRSQPSRGGRPRTRGRVIAAVQRFDRVNQK